MSEIVLKQLLEIKKNDKKLNKEQQKLYFSAVFELLSNENNAIPYMRYIVSGATLGGAKAFTTWCAQLDEERQAQELKQLLRSKEASSLKPPIRYRLLLVLLSGFLSVDPSSFAAIKILVQWIPEVAYKKDGSPIEELAPYAKAYFFDAVSDETNFPNLRSMGLSDAAVIEFSKLVTMAISDIEPRKNVDKNKKTKIITWLKECVPQKKEEAPASLTAAQANAEQGTIFPGTVEIPASVEKSDYTPTSNGDKRVRSKTARKLLALAYEWDAMSESFAQLQAQLGEKEQVIQDLSAQLLSVREALFYAKQQYAAQKAQMEELAAEYEAVKKEKNELENRVFVQSSVLNVYADDKKNAQEEQLNAIAAALVRSYKEFLEAQTMDMTTDLEMNLVDLLEDVFKRLEKNGIDIKGRM